MPSGPHGTARYAIFNEREASQRLRLVDWTNQLANHSASEVPATVASAGSAQPPAWFLGGNAPQPLSPEAQQARPLATAGQDRAARRMGARASAKASDEAAAASFNQPADPFDPEAFNRRFAPKENAATKQ